MPYELIDHTADIGICVTETTIKGLFETAAHAMFEQITELSKLKASHTRQIQVTGIDRPDLLINFLRELLSFWTLDTLLIKRVTIGDISDNRLTAELSYDEFDPQTHEILKDIKAVTYHDISVDKIDAGWQATIIFDV